jgi:apolipoprotein N-acyltransferase
VRRTLAAAALTGALFVCSFPPFDCGYLAFVALVPLLLALEGTPRPFLAGWFAGWVGFSGVVWWVYYAMAHFGGIPWWLAAPLVLLLTAAMAVQWGLACWARARVRARFPRIPDLLLLPVLWTAAEYLRAVLPDLEFPWALAGYSQYLHLPLVQAADLGGVWGISLLVVLVNAGVAAAVVRGRRREWRPAAAQVAAALAVLALAAAYGSWRLGQPAEGGRLRVGVVQGNIPQDLKWDPQFTAETYAIHERLTREAAGTGLDLAVWPESATAFLYQQEPGYQERMATLVRETRVPLLFGSPARETVAGRRTLRNRAYLLDAGGNVAGWHDKLQLVPFGEFVPFQKLLFFARPLVQAVGAFSPGERPKVLEVPGARFSTLICYEVVFPNLVRQFTLRGAELLVNITNDAWYERSAASRQQFATLVFRAVENRRPIARAANTGISGFVDAQGRILSTSGLFVRGQYRAELTLSRRPTLYAAWGDWLPRACVAALLVLLAAAFVRRPAPAGLPPR